MSVIIPNGIKSETKLQPNNEREWERVDAFIDC